LDSVFKAPPPVAIAANSEDEGSSENGNSGDSDSGSNSNRPPVLSIADIGTKLEPLRVYFKGRTDMAPENESLLAIAEFAETAETYDTLKFYINAYADGRGDGVTNYQLSIERAKSIRQILMQTYGLPRERLILRPFGEAFPEFPDNTAEERHKNRRVSFGIAPQDAQNNALF
ncbi:MAG: OmpA family protein, partial [Bacteroidota bacterium]